MPASYVASGQWYRPTYNPSWETPLSLGGSSWNSRPEVHLYRTSSASYPSALYVGPYSWSSYGTYTRHYLPNSFTIRINSTRIAADATNFSRFAQSTISHEFGHVLNLVDNPTTTSSSIMKHSRNRNTLYNPTSWDLARVGAHY